MVRSTDDFFRNQIEECLELAKQAANEEDRAGATRARLGKTTSTITRAGYVLSLAQKFRQLRDVHRNPARVTVWRWASYPTYPVDSE
jgi:hypothetical protein